MLAKAMGAIPASRQREVLSIFPQRLFETREADKEPTSHKTWHSQDALKLSPVHASAALFTTRFARRYDDLQPFILDPGTRTSRTWSRHVLLVSCDPSYVMSETGCVFTLLRKVESSLMAWKLMSSLGEASDEFELGDRDVIDIGHSYRSLFAL